MTVLVINAPSDDGLRYLKEGRCESRAGPQLTVPITTAVVAAVARAERVPVVLRDYSVTDFDARALDPWLREARCVMLVTTTPTFPSDARFAAWVRARYPSAALVAWGTLPTALPERALAEAPGLDAVILGEPEWTARDLFALMKRQPLRPVREMLPEIDGLLVRAPRHPRSLPLYDEGFIRTPSRHRVDDLDALPWAARDLLDNDRYTEPSTNRAYTVIQVSRGCPYPCTYCTVANYHGKPQRQRSPASIVDEVRHCVTRHGIRSFLFLSDLFTFDRAWVLALCEALCAARLDIRWFCNSRADTFDPTLARAMRAAGCYLVSFGVESASPEIQRSIRKPTKATRMAAAADACRAAGIRSYFYWVLGFLGETRDTIRETVDVACGIDSDFASFTSAVPYPGTALYEDARRGGRLRHEDWSRYEASHCDALVLDALSPEELAREVRQASARFYLRPSYLASVHRRFTPSELASLARRGVGYLPSLLLPRTTLARLRGRVQ